MLRSVFYIAVIASFFGLGLCDLMSKNWRLGLASMLLGIVQAMIFYGR